MHFRIGKHDAAHSRFDQLRRRPERRGRLRRLLVPEALQFLGTTDAPSVPLNASPTAFPLAPPNGKKDREKGSMHNHPPAHNPNLTRNLYAGIDVGRTNDLTVITVLEKQNDLFLVRAILRLRNTRLPEQQTPLEEVCRSPRFAAAHIDMTGLGLGLYEYTSQKFGDRIRGINFASSISLDANGTSLRIPPSVIRNDRVPVPEALALRLLQTYESKRIRHPIDPLLREDLRKPERMTIPEGRVSIVASRTESGHADHFWSIALALDAAQRPPPAYLHVVYGLRPERIERNFLI